MFSQLAVQAWEGQDIRLESMLDTLGDQEYINRAGVAVALANELEPYALGVAELFKREIGGRAEEIEVDSAESFETASNLLKEIKAFSDRAEERRKELKAPVFEGGKRIDGIFATMAAPLAAARAAVEQKVLLYRSKVDEERRRQEAEMRRQAEEERKRAQAEAVREAKRAGGGADEIAAVKEDYSRPVAVAAPAPSLPQTGVSTRVTYEADVHNMRAFVQACLDGTEGASLYMLKPEAAALNAIVRSAKGVVKIPGVRAIEKRSLSVRG